METPLFGNYRAKVVDNKDLSKYGRVKVWVPDIMPNVEDTKGLWARPANNQIGGRNMENNSEHHYMGSSYIPKIGSWTWIFFEAGNINRPYYFGALDLENTKVLPENQQGENYEDKWTILKTHEGRVIHISDDPDDERVEITGKKRTLTEPPTGDLNSVYEIDGNQTVILLDERAGKEKILIRTHKGDFFHIDVDEQMLQIKFESDVHIQTNGSFYLSSKEDVHIKSDTKGVHIQGQTDVHVKAKVQDVYIESEGGSIYQNAAIDTKSMAGKSSHLKCGLIQTVESGGMSHIKSGSVINLDAATINSQCGAVSPAEPSSKATDATSADPKGERDT